MSDITAVTAQTWDKTPEEVRPFGMNFSGLLASGESLAGVTSVTYTVEDGGGGTTSDLTIGSPSYSNSTNIATVSIGGGKPGVKYRIMFIVTTTTAGTILRSDGLLNVTNT